MSLESSSTYVHRIEGGAVERFARAIGAESLCGVPPTYLTVMRDAEIDLVAGLGFSLRQLIHGDQSYEFMTQVAPLSVGDTLEYRSRLLQRTEKKSGTRSLLFLIVETAFERRTLHGSEPVALAKTTLVVRS